MDWIWKDNLESVLEKLFFTPGGMATYMMKE